LKSISSADGPGWMSAESKVPPWPRPFLAFPPRVRFSGPMGFWSIRRTLAVASSAIFLALIGPEAASAQRRPVPELHGAVEVHPSIALASGAGAGLGIDFRGTYWAAFERGYRAGPDRKSVV